VPLISGVWGRLEGMETHGFPFECYFFYQYINNMSTKICYGFTGTRNGLNNKQKEEIKRILENDNNNNLTIEVYHGDCVGADADFHDICRNVSANIKIYIIK